MSYKLLKPYTDKQRMDFIVQYNHNRGLQLEETNNALFALAENEIIVDGEVIIDPTYEEQKKQQRQAQFDKEFFKTSLGYVRRNVSMKTGETKDFLADILPVLEVGVPIIFYDMDLNQSKKMVTEVFLAECKEQILKDFWGE